MSDNNCIYQQDYRVTSLSININKKLGLFGLLGFLQDVAVNHAEDLGFGYEGSMKNGFFWVIVGLKLKMHRWPNWNDILTVQSWTKPVFGILAIREFELFVNGELVGECSTSWMILDIETRRPKKIENIENQFVPRLDHSLDFTAGKIVLPESLASSKTYEVRISDLDMNNHVNNIKYSQWVLDSIPQSSHRSHAVSEYEINFQSETFLGDTVELFTNLSIPDRAADEDIYFSGVRTADAKSVFSARLKAHQLD